VVYLTLRQAGAVERSEGSPGPSFFIQVRQRFCCSGGAKFKHGSHLKHGIHREAVMDHLEGTLAGIEFLRALPPDVIEALSKRCQWHRYSSNQLIVGQDDETRDVFFIVRGKVRVIVYAASGKEVSFRDLRAGQMFGELSAIDGQPRSATVIALQEALMARMPPNVFWAVMERHPQVAAAVLQHLVSLVRALSDRVFEFSTLAVKNRIHAELLRLAREASERNNGAMRISPAPTHAEIASRISTHREAVTRELNEMVRAGLVERCSGGLIIRDIERLARLVEDVTEL
jgi:CRP-like cAMP-binding protein